MWDYLSEKESRYKRYLTRYEGQGRLVGITERGLYYGALFAGQPFFISVWFTLKTVAQSPRWGKDKGPVQGRGIFQPFLVGSGMSLLFSAGGFYVADLLMTQGSIELRLLKAGFILLALLTIWGFSRRISSTALDNLRREKAEARRRRRKRKSKSM